MANFSPKPCPKCGKSITAKVEPRLTKEPIEELMRKERIPFFQHVDVRYWCETANCGYRCHRTYKDGHLISEHFSIAFQNITLEVNDMSDRSLKFDCVQCSHCNLVFSILKGITYTKGIAQRNRNRAASDGGN